MTEINDADYLRIRVLLLKKGRVTTQTVSKANIGCVNPVLVLITILVSLFSSPFE